MTLPIPPLAIVVIAAGKGTRMRSPLAKVLHPLAGRPLLAHVLDIAASLAPQHLVVVVGHHAVAQAEPVLADFPGDILVLYGDVPLLQPTTLQALWDTHRRQQAIVTVLTACLDNPTGYGRILRDADRRIVRIVEERDASETEK